MYRPGSAFTRSAGNSVATKSCAMNWVRMV
jgi:hypothetical protein